MISAKEARTISSKNLEDKANKSYNDIISKVNSMIEQACNKGEDSIRYVLYITPESHKAAHKVKEHLNELGYNVKLSYNNNHKDYYELEVYWGQSYKNIKYIDNMFCKWPHIFDLPYNNYRHL